MTSANLLARSAGQISLRTPIGEVLEIVRRHQLRVRRDLCCCSAPMR
jgi:hypothetical protein